MYETKTQKYEFRITLASFVYLVYELDVQLALVNYALEFSFAMHWNLTVVFVIMHWAYDTNKSVLFREISLDYI